MRSQRKSKNHAHSVAIRFMHYNFVRIHQSLGVTPTMRRVLLQRFDH